MSSGNEDSMGVIDKKAETFKDRNARWSVDTSQVFSTDRHIRERDIGNYRVQQDLVQVQRLCKDTPVRGRLSLLR